MELAQPSGIADISLAPRHVLGVTRIDQDNLEPALLENLVRRDPIDPGGFHRNTGHTAGFEPVGQISKSCVNVPNARTGVSVQTGSTAAMCIFDPMSIAAAPTLTGFNSGRSSIVLLGIANPPSGCWKEGLGY